MKILCILYDDPKDGMPTSYPIKDLPKINSYPDGQSLPSPKSIDFNQILELLNSHQISSSNIRFFLGYSGWSKNQLVKEIAENAWIVSEFDSSKVISLNDNLWQSVLSDKGGRYKIVSNCPKDPTSN